MMPKIYAKKITKSKKPMPMITVDEDMVVVAVTPDGSHLAHLFNSKERFPCAKAFIEGWGYSTDWAEWDDEGRFVRLKHEDS